MRDVFKEVFMSMSDDELRKAIQEIDETKINGLYEEDSIVRSKLRELKQEFNNTSFDLMFFEINILRVAYLRWLESFKKRDDVVEYCNDCKFCSRDFEYSYKYLENMRKYTCSKNNLVLKNEAMWDDKVIIPESCPLK